MKDYNELYELHRSHKPDKEDEEKILNEENLFPFNAKLGMVFTSHKGHMPFMKYVLQQYRKIDDMFIIGAYDPKEITPNSENRLGYPYPDIWSLAHMWVTKHRTWGGMDKRHGWIWLNIYSSCILRQFKNIKYIFTANGDCVWDRPEGVYELIDDILGDNDFMSGQSETREEDGWNFIHTCSMVFKRKAYFNFIDYMIEKIKNSNTASFSPEFLMHEWVTTHDIKWNHAPIQPKYTINGSCGEGVGQSDIYCEDGGESTWRNILGFKNLEAEKNFRCSNHKEPLDKKYFDMREFQIGKAPYYRDHDKKTLCMYYKTGDYRYLKMWWDLDPISVPREERIERMKKKLEDY